MTSDALERLALMRKRLVECLALADAADETVIGAHIATAIDSVDVALKQTNTH